MSSPGIPIAMMPAPLEVFDMESCQRRLSGGYITLLFGVAAASDAGRELLANTELRSHLANMGCQVGRPLPADRTGLTIHVPE